MERKTVWIPVIAFLALIFGGMIWGLLKPDQAYSDTENRYLASRPEFSWESLFAGSYTQDYESYITDQFPERDRWIGLKTRTEMLLGKAETKNVWLADDDYLIVDYPASDFEGEQAGQNRDTLAQALAYYTDKLGGDHVRVLLAPTSSQILRDKLPAHSPVYDQSEYLEEVIEASREALAAAGTEGGAESLFVKAEEALSAHAGEYIYYRTDHHWTTLGAYYAYCAWAKSMGFAPAADPGLRAVAEDFWGTTYSRLHAGGRADVISVYDTDTAVTLTHNLTERTAGFYDWDALATRDKYAVFLGGNDGLLEIDKTGAEENADAQEAEQAQGMEGGAEESKESVLLVVKDSFANSFIPYAMEHFDRIVVVDLRYMNMSLRQLAEQYGVTDLLVLYSVQAFATDATVFKLGR